MDIFASLTRKLEGSPVVRQLRTISGMRPYDLLERFWSHGLRLHDFTALFGCRDPVRARELLLEQERSNVYADVYGLHSLRWMLFDGRFKNGVEGLPGSANQALALSFVCDGNVGDLIAALLEKKRSQLLDLLSLCQGFDPTTDPAEFIKAHSIPSGYLFRDLGPVGPKWSRLPDPTLAEIKDAFDAEGKFARLFAKYGAGSPRELRQQFLQAFGETALPFPLRPVERRVPEEEVAVRQLTDAARKLQDKAARASNDRVLRRGAHAKAHGLIEASFEILDIPSQDHRVGLFSERRVYQALLRSSNASGLIEKDSTSNARGLALRVLVPAMSPLAGAQPQFLLDAEAGEHKFQDFVLMNFPVFVAPNVQRFAQWFCTLQSESAPGRLAGVAALSASRQGLREVGILARTAVGYLAHPLRAAYHSTTPYQLGERFIAKYSLEPDDPKAFRRFVSPLRSGYLSTELTRSLRSRPLQLNFNLHVLSVDAVPDGFESIADVVEDATLDWDALGAEKVPVAIVRIGPQDPASVERLAAAERIRFNPWNALVQHRPLGSLNRARFSAYRVSQQYRNVQLSARDSVLPQAAE